MRLDGALPQPVALLFGGRSVYLFYVDESGDPNAWDSQDNFVLAGVAVHEGQVRRLSHELSDVQRHFFPGIAIPLEFHAHHVFGGKGRFRGLAPRQRTELMDQAYRIIAGAGFPDLAAFITAIHVSVVSNPHQALRDCLEDICQRFNTFLAGQSSAGHQDKGLLIMDRSGREARVRELMSEFEQHGTRQGDLDNIVDVPHFAESSHTRMLQLADLLAFAGGRYFNSNDDRFLQVVLPRIGRKPTTGELIGLRHIVAADHGCSCMAIH